MPIGTPVGNLDIANATLRTSNLETQNIKIGSIFVGTGNSLEETANVGNSMSNTIQFTNTHTAFTTTGNVTVGKELTVTGNVTVSKDLTVTEELAVTGNATVSKDLTVTEELAVTGNATVSKDLTVTEELAVTGNVGIGTVSPQEKLHVNGNIRLGGPQGTDEDASYYIKSAGQIHINSATDGTADDSYICLDLRAGQSGSNRAGIGICGAATNTSYQKIAFETADQEQMSISSQGYFKYNNQPRFSAYSNSSDANYGAFSGGPVKLTSTFYNVGSHYSTSTGAFTAPITGHYRFSITPFNNASSRQVSMWYRTSNSGTWDDIGPYKLLGGSPNGDETIFSSSGSQGNSWTIDLYVPVNYQIGFGGRGGVSITIYRAHSYFSGELISAA